MPHYQLRPTCSGINFVSEEEAVQLIEACLHHPSYFPLLPSRIGTIPENRTLVAHGNTFVFERRIRFERWSDWGKWMPSEQIDLWIVSEEAERVHQVETDGKALEEHPKISTYYLPAGLLRKSITITMLSAVLDKQKKRTFEVVSYVDPRRYDDLRPANTDAILHRMTIPSNTYFSRKIALPRTTPPIPRRSNRFSTSHGTTFPGLVSNLPSLSPTTTPGLTLSISPATAPPTLSPIYPSRHSVSSRYHGIPTGTILPAFEPNLPPIPTTVSRYDVLVGKQIRLPPLGQVLGDLEMRVYSSVESRRQLPLY